MSNYWHKIEKISEVVNVSDFLSTIKKIPINLVFIETELHDMNGIDLTILALQKNPDLLIYALSYFDVDENMNAMINAGAKGFISKNEDINYRLNLILNGNDCIEKGKKGNNQMMDKHKLKYPSFNNIGKLP